MENATNKLISHLERYGFRSAVVSIHRVKDLQLRMNKLLRDKNLNKDFYERYLSKIDFRIPEGIPETGSIIIVAAQQPKVVVEFKLNGQTHSFIIPPTYSYETDKKIYEVISYFLSKYNSHVYHAILPVKLLAVQSGLATYGRNNIAYINGWGSFFRLKAFYSDMPSNTDHWNDLKLMDRCTDCIACINKCPTNAIFHDEIHIHTERCLTFMNEGPDDFPEWVVPNWHNCLIGCMVCQDVCPLNKNFRKSMDLGCEFTEEETMMILQENSKNTIPGETAAKFKKLCIFDEYEVVRRNLRVLLGSVH